MCRKRIFYNLSEEKKYKIFDATVKELSNRRFSDASLNQIIKAAREYARIAAIQSQENDPFVKKYFELQEEQKQAVIKIFERINKVNLFGRMLMPQLSLIWFICFQGEHFLPWA